MEPDNEIKTGFLIKVFFYVALTFFVVSGLFLLINFYFPNLKFGVKKETDNSVSVEEKYIILEELSKTASTTSEEAKLKILNDLEKQNGTTTTESEKLKILESLNNQ